ncbi:MAG: undecaprenyl diphosphate synthase family protein [Candidatus Kariarchaeaceae archaeon]|jgi:hypothetical protein
MRRYARKYHVSLAESYQLGARRLVDLVETILLRQAITEELSLYPLAVYNLSRASEEIDGIRVWCDYLIQDLHSLWMQYPFEVSLLGRLDLIEHVAPKYFPLLEEMVNTKRPNTKSRSNLLFAYDSLRSWPSNLPVFKWKPFRKPINIIYRFGQPVNMVRGSAIFPMSDQAYWTSTTDLFLETEAKNTKEKLQSLIERVKKHC